METMLILILIIFGIFSLYLFYTNIVSSILENIYQTACKVDLYYEIDCLENIIEGYKGMCESSERVIKIIKDAYIKDDEVSKYLDTFTGAINKNKTSDTLKGSKEYIISMLNILKDEIELGKYGFPDWLLPAYVKKEREETLKSINTFMKELKEKIDSSKKEEK